VLALIGGGRVVLNCAALYFVLRSLPCSLMEKFIAGLSLPAHYAVEAVCTVLYNKQLMGERYRRRSREAVQPGEQTTCY
jgi:hypothetical protein